jgi:hypothetical protein
LVDEFFLYRGQWQVKAPVMLKKLDILFWKRTEMFEYQEVLSGV